MPERQVVALGLPDGEGDGPLAGEVVPMPAGATSVDAEVEITIDDMRATRRTWTYHLVHLAVPPRSSNRYHLLVPSDHEHWDQTFAAAVRMLLDVDAATRKAVACLDTLCELTSLQDVVES